MAWMRPMLGGDTTDYLELHRYCNSALTQNIGSHWTDWRTDSRESASRMTGVPLELISYRLTIRVNRSKLNSLFTDHGTKYVPGEGSGIEYVNKNAVDFKYLKVDMIS